MKIDAKDYAYGLDTSELFSEMNWGSGFNSDDCYEYMIQQAKMDEVELTGLDEFDHDRFFYECYRADSDKGLS